MTIHVFEPAEYLLPILVQPRGRIGVVSIPEILDETLLAFQRQLVEYILLLFS